MSPMDSYRGLILFGYVSARIGDGEFKRAAIALVIGIALLAIFNCADRIFRPQ